MNVDDKIPFDMKIEIKMCQCSEKYSSPLLKGHTYWNEKVTRGVASLEGDN